MTRIADLYRTLEYGPAPENPEPARSWLEVHGPRFGHFIGGEWVTPEEGVVFPTANPASGEELARVAQGCPKDVSLAVRAASAALDGWQENGPAGRARFLYALARSLQRDARLFAVLETMDCGKPIRDSGDVDVPLAIRHFFHHAGWARLLEEDFPGRVGYGVVGQIIPSTSPFLMLARQVAPALAAGSTVVVKPADHTPLTALLFAQICQKVGLPAGVVNIVTGDQGTGASLLAHPGIGKLAFTGSSEGGREIRRATAHRNLSLTLELEENPVFVVFADSDLDSAVEGVVDAICLNHGQTRCAGIRILAQEGIALPLEEKLRARMDTLRMGDPLDKGMDLGPIVAPVQRDGTRSLVDRDPGDGARIQQPSWASSRAEEDPSGTDLFFPPRLYSQVAPSGTVSQVETYGPVATLSTFRTPAEAVTQVNPTHCGCAVSLWTENVSLALEVIPRLRADTVRVNDTHRFDAAWGFGGYRESRIGREGMEEYLRPAWEVGKPPRGVADSRPASLIRPALGAGLADPTPMPEGKGIDRTARLFIGGRRVHPEGGQRLALADADGSVVALIPRGTRKDVHHAVEAARRAAPGWSGASAHFRAETLYSLADNLSAQAEEFEARLREGAGLNRKVANAEVALSLARILLAAARADKWEGRIHETPGRRATLAMVEPLGVLGIVCPPEAPLLSLISLVAPALAMGNTTVVIPSPTFPLSALDLPQMIGASDLPAGVMNVVCGLPEDVVPSLAEHDDVDGIWAFGEPELLAGVRRRSAGNLKRCWTPDGRSPSWIDPDEGAGEAFYRRATRVKTVWLPYGV